jgi:Fibronectin type III domain
MVSREDRLQTSLLTSETGGTPPGPLDKLVAKPKASTAHLSWATSTRRNRLCASAIRRRKGTSIAYVTKETKMELSGLETQTTYTVKVAAVNLGGSTQSSVQFKTK